MNALVKGLKVSDFWGQLTIDEFDVLYTASIPTPERVISLLEADERNRKDGQILTWIHRFIRSTPTLKALLRFITGSESLHTSLSSRSHIRVKFLDSTETDPMPTTLTCFRIFNVPRSFISYCQLERNFTNAITKKEQWTMEDNVFLI